VKYHQGNESREDSEGRKQKRRTILEGATKRRERWLRLTFRLKPSAFREEDDHDKERMTEKFSREREREVPRGRLSGEGLREAWRGGGR